MIDFIRDISVNDLLLSGFVGGVLAGISCGAIGPLVVIRRIVFLTGAIAHIVVGGIGATIFLRYQFAPALDGVEPLYGALVAALLAALVIGLVQHYSRERLDTLIGALWAVGMAVGILLVKFTPGYHTEIFSYLFGNIAVVSWTDVWLIAVLDTVLIGTLALYHKRLLAVCLDEEHAQLRGVSVLATNLILLALVALSVVALIRVVGLILVIALLSLPAATAGHLTRRLGAMVVTSMVLCVLLTTVPRMAVYGTRISPESAIVLAAAGAYLLALIWKKIPRRRSGAGG